MKVLNFDIVSFLVSSLSTPFLIQGHGKLLPCVLNVIVSSLTFKSMIHLELIFVFSRRMVPDLIFLHVLMQLYEHHLLERLFFFFSHFYLFIGWAGSSLWLKGFSSCSTRAWLPSGMWDLSSPARAQTHIPCIRRQILYHWTTREVPAKTTVCLLNCPTFPFKHFF